MAKQLFGVAMLSVLAACSSPQEVAENTGVATARAQAGDTAAVAQSGKAAAAYEFEDSAEKDGGERTFSYAWPQEVARIPELAALLDQRRKDALAEQQQYWSEALEACPPDAVSCRNSSFELEWQVVADTPRFLSLSNGMYTYSGGAHGMYGRDTLVWDRETKSAMNPLEFFTAPEALAAAIRPAACTLLNEERAERRGEPVPQGDTEWPNQCPTMEESVIFLGSSGGKTFDRIGIYYGPYVAGPYVEGDYEFTVPVTEAVLGAVKRDYREAFSRGK